MFDHWFFLTLALVLWLTSPLILTYSNQKILGMQVVSLIKRWSLE